MLSHTITASRTRSASGQAFDCTDRIQPAAPLSLPATPRASQLFSAAVLAALLAIGSAQADPVAPFAASERARQLDAHIDWDAAKIIAVQDGGRYKALDSFARERMAGLFGRESFPGLSPMSSLMEWIFNRDAYVDTPVVYIKDLGVRHHLTASPSTGQRTTITEAARQRILKDKYMTPRELTDPLVRDRIDELEPRAVMVTAMRRVREAEATAFSIDRMVGIVPQPAADRLDAWHPIQQLAANTARSLESAGEMSQREVLDKVGAPVPGYTAPQAFKLLKPWIELRELWLNAPISETAGVAAADATPSAVGRRITAKLGELAQTLRAAAGPGVYPAESQLRAEAKYYAAGKYIWGSWFYLVGALISVQAFVTRWKIPWALSIAMLFVALGVHGYGLGLRWYILDRIPVANMFEALTASAFAGVVVGLLAELLFRTRVFALSAHVLGFVSLLIAGFVLPGGGTITTVMGILDDLMLRIHTTLIITSYALIFLAAVIGVVYLLGYYFRSSADRQLGRLGPADYASAPPIVGMGFAAVGGLAAPPTDRAMLDQRPVLAGAAPGDERRRDIPEWLNQLDWCHLIILNIVFVILFIGIILGAVWADYSWGRPWGWDPKEVFAMNTWIIYAILIHTRFVVKNRGLWTAWLSVAGCIMMIFNWWVVNFYIVGLHSYA